MLIGAIASTQIMTNAAVELKVLTVQYGEHTVPCIWCGLKLLPSREQLVEVMQAVVLCMADPSCARTILHFEHISATGLIHPTAEFIKVIVAVLLENKKIISNKLMCSIFQAQTLDLPTMVMRDLFLSLYTPQKELVMTDDKEEIEEFVRDQLEKISHID